MVGALVSYHAALALAPLLPAENDPRTGNFRWVTPTAAATGQYMLQQKMQYGDQAASGGSKLWVAVERHPENAKRRKLPEEQPRQR